MNNILLDSTVCFNKEGTFKLELDKDTTINIESDNVKLYLVTKNNIKVDFNILNSTTIYNITEESITVNSEDAVNTSRYYYVVVDYPSTGDQTATDAGKQISLNIEVTQPTITTTAD